MQKICEITFLLIFYKCLLTSRHDPMNMRSIMRFAILTAFLLAQFGCKDRGNPLDKLFSKTQDEHNLAEPPASMPVKTDFVNKPHVNLSIENPNPQLFQPEVLAKVSSEMTVAPPPPPGPFTPPPPPPVPAPPIPVDDLNGFVEYDGPIYSLCGNGVLNRVVNRIACPAFNPIPIFESPFKQVPDKPCTGFVYIEQCDDGNTIDNDGCSSVCLKECCGNGIVEEGEECDVGLNRGPVLPEISPPSNFPITTAVLTNDANALFTRPFAACSRLDLVVDSGNCSRNCQFIICGDGIVNGNEQCDDGNNLSCDGCFKCTLEKPGTCPCNCCPFGQEACGGQCCPSNQYCATSPAPPGEPPPLPRCACRTPDCNGVCCPSGLACQNNVCAPCATNIICNGSCCTPGQTCGKDGGCVGP